MAAAGSQELLFGVKLYNFSHKRGKGVRGETSRRHRIDSIAWPRALPHQTLFGQSFSSRGGESSSLSCHLLTSNMKWNSGTFNTPAAGLTSCRGKTRVCKAVADKESVTAGLEARDHEMAVLASVPQDYPFELEQVNEREVDGLEGTSLPVNGSSNGGVAVNGAVSGGPKKGLMVGEIRGGFSNLEDRGGGNGNGNGAAVGGGRAQRFVGDSIVTATAATSEEIPVITTAASFASGLSSREDSWVVGVEAAGTLGLVDDGSGSLAVSRFVDMTDADFARTLKELTERGGGELGWAREEMVGGTVEYVEVEGTCTVWQAMLNAVNILLGVGLLTIPYAMSQGGWSALGVLAFLGYVTNYTGKLLGRCQSSMCLVRGPSGEGILERGLRTYEDIGEAAFGEAGRKFITGILYTELIGTCGLFFILEGDNLATLFGGDPKLYMIASALVLLPTTWLPDLSALAALGALGALASFSVLGVVLYSFISGGFPAGPGTALLHPETLPLTFGLLAFVYAGHAVFPNIQSSMKEPELYPQMLDYTYIAVGAVCALVGAVGYQMFGSNAMEEITLNLPSGELTVIATSLIIINPFTKFALTMEPVAQGLEGILGLRTTGVASTKEPKERALIHPPSRVLARSALGASALFLATSVPFFGGVMALVGSSLTLAVSVIFPAAAYLALFGRQIPLAERAWNYFIIALGAFCAAIGTYTAFEALQSGSATHLL